MKVYVCSVCGFEYDEAAGLPDSGISPGTKWEDLPDGWECPLCGAPKGAFEVKTVEKVSAAPVGGETPARRAGGMTAGQMSALCSNFAKGCEKQYRTEESALFAELAAYFEGRMQRPQDADLSSLAAKVSEDLPSYPAANAVAAEKADRGALRALKWGEKVTTIGQSVLRRYDGKGAALLENTNIHVCEICGFVYIGDAPPDVCPVCKVPKLKIATVAGR